MASRERESRLMITQMIEDHKGSNKTQCINNQNHKIDETNKLLCTDLILRLAK